RCQNCAPQAAAMGIFRARAPGAVGAGLPGRSVAMLVAGIMSGTSADGIDLALVEIAGGTHAPRIRLRGHATFPYAAQVRRAVLAVMNAQSASVADLARLNFLLGELYADAVAAAQKRFRLTPALVGCHGQTIYHQGTPAPFLGRTLAVTWQTGEASRIA